MLPLIAMIDGIPCELISVGNAIGEVSGMVQAIVRVPSNSRAGSSIPLQVTVGGVASQPGVTVSIQ